MGRQAQWVGGFHVERGTGPGWLHNTLNVLNDAEADPLTWLKCLVLCVVCHSKKIKIRLSSFKTLEI